MYGRRNFSFVARYLLKFTRCSLLVEIHSLLVTRCKITRCSLQNSVVTRCRSCPLQNSLVTRSKIRLLLVAEVASCRKSLVACCKNAPVTRCRSCSFQKITGSRCKIPLILIAKNHSSLKQSPAGIIVCLKSTKLDESFSFFNIICFLGPKNSKLLKSTYYAEICCYQNIV